MKEKQLDWGIYLDTGNSLELQAWIQAGSYEKAVEKARKAGFGKNFRVELLDDYIE